MSETRAVSFSKDEKQIILQLVDKYKVDLKNKRSDAVSVSRRNKVWLQLREEFHAFPGVKKRTSQQLKKCWMNMQDRLKRDKAAEAEKRQMELQLSPASLDQNHSLLYEEMIDSFLYMDQDKNQGQSVPAPPSFLLDASLPVPAPAPALERPRGGMKSAAVERELEARLQRVSQQAQLDRELFAATMQHNKELHEARLRHLQELHDARMHREDEEHRLRMHKHWRRDE